MPVFDKSLKATAGEAAYTLKDLVAYFLKLGSLGFGGPVALVGRMHKDLVEEKEWIAEEEYKEGLALAQLAPGPLAAQLAIYLGYVHYSIIGATAAGIAFVLPSFLMVIVLGMAYVSFGGLPWMQAVFYGIGAAVIGIISVGSYKLIRKSVGKDWLLWTIFVTVAFYTFLFEKESIALILIGSFIYCFARTKPSFLFADGGILFPFLLQAGFSPVSSPLQKLFWFFLKAGAFVFGSGLAIVPFLYGGVVKEYHWLSEKEFLDAVAVAMITPGPVVITVGFIGFLIAGFPGASTAALATFLPCYLFTILPAPYFKRYGKHPAIKALVEGITAGAVGAIAGAVLVLAKRQFTDLVSPVIALVTILALLYFKKLQEPYIILIAAALGLFIKRF